MGEKAEMPTSDSRRPESADKPPQAAVPKCLLRDVYGDPVGLHDVAHVPVRAHRPVVTEGLYTRLQRDHVPSRLGSRYPRLIRRYLLELRNLVSVGSAVDVAEVDHTPLGQKRPTV